MLNTVVPVPKNSLTISAASKADPSVVTTEAHGLTSGQTVTISGSDSVPRIDGARVVTVTAPTTFSVPVLVLTGQTFNILSASVASPTVITTTEPHLLLAGTTDLTIAGTDTTPVLDGVKTCTYIDATTFSIAVEVTDAGTGSTGTANYGRAGTEGTAVIEAVPVPGVPLTGRASLLVQNVGTGTAYLGSSSVTADEAITGGVQLLAGQSISLDLAEGTELYCAAAVATVKLVALETASA
jgi:hypothetical protein